MISGIIKVKLSVISRRLRLLTLAETLMILDVTKTESKDISFIIHCFKENNDKRIYRTKRSLFLTSHVLTSLSVYLTLLLEIMHCTRNLQLIH